MTKSDNWALQILVGQCIGVLFLIAAAIGKYLAC